MDSLVVADNATSSASVEERVISPWSLHPHVSGTPAYMMMKPVRYLVVLGSYISCSSFPFIYFPVNDASTNTSMDWFGIGFTISPSSLVASR